MLYQHADSAFLLLPSGYQPVACILPIAPSFRLFSVAARYHKSMTLHRSRKGTRSTKLYTNASSLTDYRLACTKVKISSTYSLEFDNRGTLFWPPNFPLFFIQ